MAYVAVQQNLDYVYSKAPTTMNFSANKCAVADYLICVKIFFFSEL